MEIQTHQTPAAALTLPARPGVVFDTPCIVLMGPPGSGKGTHATRLSRELGVSHLVMSDLLRAELGAPFDEATRESYPRMLAEMDSGKFLPDEFANQVLQKQLTPELLRRGFVLDGFPRTRAQAEWLSQYLEQNGARVSTVIELGISDEVALERILKRQLSELPRADGSEEIARERLALYHATTAPAFEFFKSRGEGIMVSGLGRPEETFERLWTVLSAQLLPRAPDALSG